MRGAPDTGLEKVAGEEKTPGRPAQGELVVENASDLLEKVKQDEEAGSSFLVGVKPRHPAQGRALGSILLPPRTCHVQTNVVSMVFVYLLHVSLCWMVASLMA